LWSEGAQRSLAAFAAAEIVTADLAPLALDLADWGARDANSLAWLDPPPAATLAGARTLLERLGALDATGRITLHGREIARTPAHPRLAHMLVRARELGCAWLGAELAALLAERDLLRQGGPRPAPDRPPGALAVRDGDIDTRLEVLRGSAAGGGADAQVDRGTLERARRAATQFARGAGRDTGTASSGLLLACAYPDRIGRLRGEGEGRYALTNGRGAVFAHPDRLARREFIVAIDLDDRDRDARILLAAALDRDDIEAAAGARIERSDLVEWSPRDAAVVARRVERLDALLLAEKPLNPPPPDATLAAMLEGLRQMGLEALPWDDECRNWQARVALARARKLPGSEAWPDCSDVALLDALGEWLAPWLAGVTRKAHLARVPLAEAPQARLGYERQRRLDEWLPSHVVLPTGSRARIDYVDALAPCASMRMQEVFGLAQTPRIGGGAIPVTFKLLSPAQRPLQITRDLASFWAGAYAEVRKDMRGRYPRHYWPENPLLAEPTRGIKRRS
jgi:ATP-dependent helicase HrpB